MSTTPALCPILASSPAQAGSARASCRGCTLGDLYEQCSLHTTEYSARSAPVGSPTCRGPCRGGRPGNANRSFRLASGRNRKGLHVVQPVRHLQGDDLVLTATDVGSFLLASNPSVDSTPPWFKSHLHR